MTSRLNALALAAGMVIVWPVSAAERTCTFGETVRRIEVRYEGEAGRPPCAVVYTKETEAPGLEEVLWTAQQDAGFCQSRAAGLVQLLERSGWRCGGSTADAEASQTRAQEPARAAVEEPDERPLSQESEPSSQEPPQAMAGEEPAPAPPPRRSDSTDLAATSERDPPPDQAPADGPVGDLEQPEPADRTNGPDEDDTPTDMARLGGTFIPAAALDAAVERDLARLKKSAEDEVEATVGSFGDLNGDDVEDAAVLITFDAEGNDHAQYLVAYVAEDGTYRPAASRFIGGRYRKIFGAEVKGIEDGRIELDLKVLTSSDPYCCPSGSETIAFRLENGELIEGP